jgi:hypothetical protein
MDEIYHRMIADVGAVHAVGLLPPGPAIEREG